MNKRSLKFGVIALALTMATGIFAGCASKSDNNSATDSGKGSAIAGSITISGSTALKPLIDKAGENFQAKNKDAQINSQGGGSGTGLTQVLQGAVEIGDSDVPAADKLKSEEASQLVDHQVVALGFAVTVSKDVPVTNLTKAQIADIFSGKVTNWKAIDGKTDLPITVVHRPASSGTRATFMKTVLDGKKDVENDKIGVVQDANGSVKTALESTKGSISYVALSYLLDDEAKKSLVPVSIEGVQPTKENITTGKYIFWSWEHMYTKGEAKDLAKAFIDYITSADNKKAVEDLGFISVGDMKVK
ncbi:phosphate ABC transporter substrate-binding protein [Clostridium folliculivorans]|uniref:Phosphate-binding protein n=1 Tax=Clostridium folliculivorans TaxID=2886038 RepID=A0A9W5Y214_9CLOT|nr:phosphate ABC transporter substrate-binding protein [Clostridium folliculivorans]GKU25284.1 phosphate ABC transporter substrate-binding protein [Clostridium folliculivorans]GKU28305.1 phosphate ABC transporter substrate-binding protein [Clostridium folliculivorans]